MGTSTVTIEGGAFVIRTGNLLTKFSSLESAAEQIALLHDKIERLKARLREQTLQTQQTAEQIHSAVIEALGDAIPDGIDANGHPTEQVVATTISTMRCDHEMLKDEIERLEADVAELRKNQITPEIILRVASLHTTIREQAEKIERLRELVFRAR